jgi:hypothetical protein
VKTREKASDEMDKQAPIAPETGVFRSSLGGYCPCGGMLGGSDCLHSAQPLVSVLASQADSVDPIS